MYPGKYESRMDIRAENLVYSQYIFVFEFNYLYYLYTIYLYEVKHSNGALSPQHPLVLQISIELGLS